MKPIRRPRICVEPLEARDCPSLTEVLSGSTLFIYGLPTLNSTYAGTGGLKILGKANNSFQVTDAGVNQGHFIAQNISVRLVNHIGTSITVDLGGFTMSGNLTFNMGTGAQNPVGGSSTVGTGILN